MVQIGWFKCQQWLILSAAITINVQWHISKMIFQLDWLVDYYTTGNLMKFTAKKRKFLKIIRNSSLIKLFEDVHFSQKEEWNSITTAKPKMFQTELRSLCEVQDMAQSIEKNQKKETCLLPQLINGLNVVLLLRISQKAKRLFLLRVCLKG